VRFSGRTEAGLSLLWRCSICKGSMADILVVIKG
jgi:hypothetical protein